MMGLKRLPGTSSGSAAARRFLAAAVIALACAAAPRASLALELGLTPSNVFSLWTNIDNCLVAAARTISGDDAWVETLAAIEPREFGGKRPADVLAQVEVFTVKLARLRRRAGLPPIPHTGYDDAEVTPSAVYLHSGHVLNWLVEWLIRNTDPDQLVSQFYTRHQVSGKTPSDVYGLVDLANRRLDRILAKGRS